ncbi:MAG: hypothetical protein ACOZNI_04970, partial [Myxococcota bacterium]
IGVQRVRRHPALDREAGQEGLQRGLQRRVAGHVQPARAIAVAAVSPVPWGLATLGAGASGVRLGPLVAGAAFRPLKIAVTIAAFALGWSS